MKNKRTAFVVLTSVQDVIDHRTLSMCALSSDEPTNLSWISFKPWQEYTHDLWDALCDQAFCAACELVSPNSMEFDSVLTREQEKRGIYL